MHPRDEVLNVAAFLTAKVSKRGTVLPRPDRGACTANSYEVQYCTVVQSFTSSAVHTFTILYGTVQYSYFDYCSVQ